MLIVLNRISNDLNITRNQSVLLVFCRCLTISLIADLILSVTASSRNFNKFSSIVWYRVPTLAETLLADGANSAVLSVVSASNVLLFGWLWLCDSIPLIMVLRVCERFLYFSLRCVPFSIVFWNFNSRFDYTHY